MRIAAIALSGLLAAGPPAHAQTQLDMNAAADRGFRRADQNLNAVYRQITARLTAAQRTKLVAAQRAWLQFRDAECAFEAKSVEGGSAQPMVYSACLEKVTRQRISALRAVTLDCREGDIACLFAGK